MRKYILIIFLVISHVLCADVSHWKKTGDGISYIVGNCQKNVTFYRNNVVRVTISPLEKVKQQELVIVAVPAIQNLHYKENDKSFKVSSEDLQVIVDKKNGSLCFVSLTDGKKIIEEASVNHSGFGNNDSLSFQASGVFSISSQESLYGLGQFQDGFMDYRGKEIVLSQANEIAVVPFLLSTHGYGILWNNYSKTVFSECQNKMSFMSEFGVVDYCLVAGESADQIISGYRQLTGKAPMFKKSAYGFWQSKQRYTSFDELISVVTKYRQLGLPIDNIVQDWQYWGDNSMWSSMFFESYNFPNPIVNIERLHKLNVNLMCSIWPVAGERTRLYAEMNEKNLLFKSQHWSTGKLIDFYNPMAKDIYYRFLKKGLLDNGVNAFWLDGTEPEVVNAWTQENAEKETKNLGKSHLGEMGEFLNCYSLEAVNGIYENYRADSCRDRLFILTRSAFAGQQRYATATWSGDIGASWSIMRKQIAAGLNFCMAGIPYWTHDIGAFFPSGNGGEYPNGIADPAYCELYARWFQFGAFTPIFRSHGTGTPREVYRFVSDSLVYKSLKTSLALRYRLLPYIYSNAWRVYNEDYTLMRALPMDFSDKEVKHVDNSYMFGPSLLVQPVTNPMYYFSDVNKIVIAPEYLCTENGKRGLKVEYFNGKNFEEKVYETTHQSIDFNWDGVTPEKLSFYNYSMRWKGKLLSPVSGDIELGLVADDGVRLWINNDLIIDAWEDAPVRSLSKKIKLEKNKEYDVCIESYQSKGSSEIKFFWALPANFDKKKENLNTLQTIYLPSGSYWYDFWNGKVYKGGRSVTVSSPMDRLPLFVKAGTILPMGPFVQYATEKSQEPVEIRIYRGKDASFTLYEDDNNTYNYERGQYATIDFYWDDLSKELLISERKGYFDGINDEKKFNVVLVDEEGGTGIGVTEQGRIVHYHGKAVKVNW